MRHHSRSLSPCYHDSFSLSSPELDARVKNQIEGEHKMDAVEKAVKKTERLTTILSITILFEAITLFFLILVLIS